MRVALWPLVPREVLVSAFRPGVTSEAPFRCLREHGWSTAGVRLTPRTTGGHAAGRITVFSTLNFEAAILARLKDTNAAHVAKLAQTTESSRSFAKVLELLSTLPASSIGPLVHGTFPSSGVEALWQAFRLLAAETHERWQRAAAKYATPEIIAGRVVRIGASNVVLEVDGREAFIPRRLAQAAHPTVGGCIGIVIDHLANGSAFTYVLPALDLDGAPPRHQPFGTHGAPTDFTAADLELFRRKPAALRVPFPVTIGE